MWFQLVPTTDLIKLTLGIALLVMSASSDPCYPGAIFPKLVGYGQANT